MSSPLTRMSPHRRGHALRVVLALAMVLLFVKVWHARRHSGSPQASSWHFEWKSLDDRFANVKGGANQQPAQQPIPIDPFAQAPSPFEATTNPDSAPIRPNPLSGTPVQRLESQHPIRETVLRSHQPGWNILDNVYMANGTLYVVTNNASSWPARNLLISSGHPLAFSKEARAAREPTEWDLSFITEEEAKARWKTTILPISDWSVSYRFLYNLVISFCRSESQS